MPGHLVPALNATCPVDGRSIDEALPLVRLPGGVSLAVCSPDCAARVRAEPERYVPPAQRSEADPAATGPG